MDSEPPDDKRPGSFRDHLVDALDSYRNASDFGETEWKRYWDDLAAAAIGGESALDVAESFSHSTDPARRHVAVDLVGLIARDHSDLAERVAGVVLGCIDHLEDEMFAASVANALGATRSPLAVPFLLGCLDSSTAPLRATAAVALVATVDRSEKSLNALVRACVDDDPEVRFWATFGLAMQTDLDTGQVRDALYGRLLDDEDRVRNEALRGLAKRGDDRARAPVEALVDEASANSCEVSPPVAMAAAFLDIG